MAWTVELNNNLRMFPGYHSDGLELQDDELLDIYEFGMPKLWQKQFLIHNIDPLSSTPRENYVTYVSSLK
jgi:hypothetical protein